MSNQWMQILYLILAALMAWIAYRMIRGNPQMFSGQNIHKSFYTLGLLAVGLIGFIALLVFLLKHS